MENAPRSIPFRPIVKTRAVACRAFLLAAIVLFVVGCASDSPNDSPTFVDSRDDLGADTGGDATQDVGSDADTTFCERLDPSGDSDGDGLLDIIEDSNRNCIVDADETDPFNPDTDGDGIPDGTEDVDQNGVWNATRGETNPRLKDSDGDGVGDELELISLACRAPATRELLTQRATLEDGSTLFIPGGYQEITPIASSSVAVRSESETRSRFGFFLKNAPALETLQMLVDVFFLNTPNDLTAHWIGERTIQGEQWIVRARFESFRPLHPRYFLELVVNGLIPEAAVTGQLETVWEQSEAEISTAEIQIAWMNGQQGPRIAVSMSTQPNDEQWFRRIHPRAIAPTEQSRLRIQCAEVPELASTSRELRVVVPQAILRHGLAANHLDGLRTLLVNGEVDRIRFVIAASSIRGKATETLVSDQESFDDLIDELVVDEISELGASATWTAVVSAASVDTGDGSQVILLITDGESVEFMRRPEGEDFLVPIEQGQERAALISAFATQLNAADVELIVAAPDDRRRVSACEDGDISAMTTVDSESSFRTLVRLAGGTLGTTCGDDVPLLFIDQLSEMLGASPFIGTAREPIWGSGVLTDRSGTTSGARFNSRALRTVVSAEEEISGVDAGLSFTFWETLDLP